MTQNFLSQLESTRVKLDSSQKIELSKMPTLVTDRPLSPSCEEIAYAKQAEQNGRRGEGRPSWG